MVGRVSAKAVIVNSDGKFLVLTNSFLEAQPQFAYAPDFPGGTVEKGETVEQALVREVKEELGIDISHAPREKLITCGWRLIGFRAEMYIVWANVRDVNLDAEHCMFSWLTLDQVRRQPWWSGYKNLFEVLEQRLMFADGAEYAEYKEAISYV